MSKRQLALEAIKCEFAQYGKPTREAMRLYIENRISQKTYKEAAMRGYMMYENMIHKIKGV